ncbi:hypothetical protein [Kiloniella sp.]|uniref:hypothetical protein n=1 Tax=Kiloniella sp. TaxID=1938587 RepID=UPI003B023F65
MTKSSSNTINTLPPNLPIGVVTYSLSGDSGELTADWAFSAQSLVETVCKGIAIPKTENTIPSKTSFVGDYSITYYGPDNQPAEPWDLSITQKGDLFTLTWSKDGELQYHGTGFLSGELLVCGWRPTE